MSVVVIAIFGVDFCLGMDYIFFEFFLGFKGFLVTWSDDFRDFVAIRAWWRWL